MSTDIYFVLDASGSMGGREHEVVAAINEYINSRRGDPDSYLSIVQFDNNRFDWIYQWQHCATARHLTGDDYEAIGRTPLNDSVARTIRLAQQNPDTDKLIIIYTDGWENASEEFPGVGNQELKDLIASLDTKHWAVTYLGEAQSTERDAAAMGASIVSNAARVSGAGGMSMAAVYATQNYYAAQAAGATLDCLTEGFDENAVAPAPPSVTHAKKSHGKSKSNSAP